MFLALGENNSKVLQLGSLIFRCKDITEYECNCDVVNLFVELRPFWISEVFFCLLAYTSKLDSQNMRIQSKFNVFRLENNSGFN